jgi:phosphatidylserine decarboxylase
LFATVYLSPRDYHRVHSPLKGKLQRAIYVPGELFSVNQATANNIPSVFARNERLILLFETSLGAMAVIFVGAMFVAGIHTVFEGQITPRSDGKIQYWDYSDKNIQVKKGDELGHFEFGSTAIMLFKENSMSWLENLSAMSHVNMGQVMGTLQ